MSETPTDPATGPLVTPSVTPSSAPAAVERRRGNRLTTVAAWVGIVAGIVFIVAVVFFSGFILGKASDGGPRGHGHGHRDHVMMHPGGPPMMGPGFGDRNGPPFGPGFRPPGAERPQPATPPTTAAPRP